MIKMCFFFESFIGKEENAKYFFDLLGSEDLIPDKIGLVEPINILFEKSKAIEFWIKEVQGNKRLAGGMMGKKRQSYSFMVSWNKGEQYVRPNWLIFDIPDNKFKKNQNKFLKIFYSINNEFNGIFCYITTEIAENRQFVPGTIETRLPGVFWCNYFSKTYVDFFGKDKFLDGPWVCKKPKSDGAVVTFLSNQPGDLLNDTEKEESAKVFLGNDSFGDKEYYRANIEEIQIRNVPKLELRELRISLNNEYKK